MANSKDTQIGGNHYKTMKIQPITLIMANHIPYCEGNIVKYICRYKNKNGVQDLNKAKQYIQFLKDKYNEIQGLIKKGNIYAMNEYNSGQYINFQKKKKIEKDYAISLPYDEFCIINNIKGKEKVIICLIGDYCRNSEDIGILESALDILNKLIEEYK